jgi:hypothetical protein
MMKWLNKTSESNCIVTLYESNITLNTEATHRFRSAFRVMIGLNTEDRVIAIKPLSKEEIEKYGIREDQMYKISIGSSYSRISNKKIIKDISEQIGLEFSETIKSFKYFGKWNEQEKYLEVTY